MAHGSRKIRHLDNVEAIGQHLGVKLGAGRQVQPLNLVFSIFVLAVVRKVLFKQVQFSNDWAASGTVDRGVLGSDAKPYFFTGLKLRCGVHRGPAYTATINDRLDYFGSTVTATLQLPRFAKPGGVVLSRAVATSEAVSEYLQANHIEAELINTGDSLVGEPFVYCL